MTINKNAPINAETFISDNLDEEGYSLPYSHLRSIEIKTMLDGYMRVIEDETDYVSTMFVSADIARKVAEWDKRYFLLRLGDSTMLRYNGRDRCKLHGYVEAGCSCSKEA